ncbi:MAG: vanadium-dependent haloperoxidase [Oscillochloris sp.]|nr:vanadium-dependent haloperoxidase [Oscillochloris sp.]
MAFERFHPTHQNNNDEQRFPNRIGNFSKGLPHNQRGEVLPDAYNAFLQALRSRRPADFEHIPLGRGRLLTNPQAGLSLDLEGPDSHAVTMPAAPAVDSAEAAGEMIEVYWMALLRDTSFNQVHCSSLAADAAAELSSLSVFKGPRRDNQVTPETLFRGFTAGDLRGPYLSQFMLQPIHYGSLVIEQRQETVPAQIDYLMRYNDWLAIQNGVTPPAERLDPTRRYMRNLRDLAHYVHVDALYQAYLNAALILLSINAPTDAGNPYNRSRTQAGFGTFGGPHILSLVTEVATRALKAVWYQKWFVHRRLRPEAYSGLVHLEKSGETDYPVHAEIRRSPVLERIRRQNLERSGEATYLLPAAFPEGSPTHPAYGAGHATVAGACVTILKAWFAEDFPLKGARFRDGTPLVISVAGDDGTDLRPYTGDDADQLTVGGELNKLAANISIGRNMAGVHWRSDYSESVRLGEQVALGILEEQSICYNEPNAFSLTTFDGDQMRIENGTRRLI